MSFGQIQSYVNSLIEPRDAWRQTCNLVENLTHMRRWVDFARNEDDTTVRLQQLLAAACFLDQASPDRASSGPIPERVLCAARTATVRLAGGGGAANAGRALLRLVNELNKSLRDFGLDEVYATVRACIPPGPPALPPWCAVPPGWPPSELGKLDTESIKMLRLPWGIGIVGQIGDALAALELEKPDAASIEALCARRHEQSAPFLERLRTSVRVSMADKKTYALDFLERLSCNVGRPMTPAEVSECFDSLGKKMLMPSARIQPEALLAFGCACRKYLDNPLSERLPARLAELLDGFDARQALAELERDFLDAALASLSDEKNSVDMFLWARAAAAALTLGFRGKRHDDLLHRLRDKADACFGTGPKVLVLQSLQDAGCDLLFDWGEGHKYGVQLKSHGDIEQADFAAKTLCQIQDSKQHGLKHLYVLLAGDLTDPSQAQKMRGFEARVSKQNDRYVTTISPDRLWTLLFE